MATDAPREGASLSMAAGMACAQLTLEEVWLRYFQLGGVIGMVEIEASLRGLMPLPRYQRNILAHALNERLAELGISERVEYLRRT